MHNVLDGPELDMSWSFSQNLREARKPVRGFMPHCSCSLRSNSSCRTQDLKRVNSSPKSMGFKRNSSTPASSRRGEFGEQIVVADRHDLHGAPGRSPAHFTAQRPGIVLVEIPVQYQNVGRVENQLRFRQRWIGYGACLVAECAQNFAKCLSRRRSGEANNTRTAGELIAECFYIGANNLLNSVPPALPVTIKIQFRGTGMASGTHNFHKQPFFNGLIMFVVP